MNESRRPGVDDHHVALVDGTHAIVRASCVDAAIDATFDLLDTSFDPALAAVWKHTDPHTATAEPYATRVTEEHGSESVIDALAAAIDPAVTDVQTVSLATPAADSALGDIVVAPVDEHYTLTVGTDVARSIENAERALIKRGGELLGHALSAFDSRETHADAETLRRYETVLDAVDDPIYALTADGTLRVHNEAMQDAFGANGSICGQHIKAVVGDEAGEAIHQQLRSLKSDEATTTTEQLVLSAGDGGETLAESRLFSVPQQGLTAVGVLQDVTARETQRQRLAAFGRAITQSTDGVAILEDDRYVYVDNTYLEMYGFESREAVIGADWRDIHTDDEVQRRLSETLPEFESAGYWRGEVVGDRLDGTQFHGELSMTGVDDARLVVTVRDITERKERVRQFEGIFEQAFSLLALIDPDGTVVRANNTMLDAHPGTPRPAEVIDTPFTDYALWSGDEETKTQLQTALDRAAAGEFVRYEVEARGENGLLILDLSLTPITDEAGTVTKIIAEGHDITRSHRQRDHLRVLHRILRHNIRNDIQKVGGYVERIQEASTEAKRTEHAETVSSIVDHWTEMTEKIRTIRKVVDAERAWSAVPVESLFTAVDASLSRMHPDAKLRMSTGEAGEVSVPTVLEFALCELVENAVEVTPEQATTVRLNAACTTDGVQLSVTDDAHGIPAIEADVLENGVESPLRHGRGIGMWMVHTITKQTGGDVQVETTENGTRVTLTVPRAASAAFLTRQ